MIIISNLHSGTKLSGWLRHCIQQYFVGGTYFQLFIYLLTYSFVFRISKQEGSFHEERIVKMEEWQTKSAPLEQLFSEQGTKWEDDEELSDLDTLKKHKQTTQVC